MGCKAGRFVKDEAGTLIPAQQALIQQKYECLHCGHTVYVKRSKYGRQFFAHEISQSCKQTHDFSEHRMIQSTLGQMFAGFGIFYKLEYEVCAGMRADLFFVIETSAVPIACVVEVQRSPLSCYNIAKRLHAYKKNGIELIWIISKPLHQCIQLRQWEQYLVACAKLLLFYDSRKRCYYYISDYLKCKITKVKIAYQHYDISNIRFLKNGASSLPQVKKLLLPEHMFWQELKLWRHGRRKRKRADSLQRLLYQLQMSVDDIPQKYYTSSIKFLNSKPSLFLMQTMLYLLIVKQGWNLRQVIKYCVDQQWLWNEREWQDITNYATYILMQK